MSSASPSARRERTRLVRTVTAVLAAALLGLAVASTSSAAGNGGGNAHELTLLLQLRHPQGLEDFVRAVSDPRSPYYGDYGTVEAIADHFGASPKAKRATMQWLREHGAKAKLGVTGTYVTARVPAAVAAYALPRTGAEAPFGGAANLRRVPAKLRSAVAAISTLGTKEGFFSSDLTTAAGKHHGHHSREPGLRGTSILPNTGTPSGCAGGSGVELVPGYGAFTPNEYLDAYGHSRLQKAGFKGQGKSIAVIEIDGFRRSDIDTFAKCFGVPSPNLQVRPVGISKPLPPGNETTLDLEVLSAIAPKLRHVYVYEGGSSEAGILVSVAASLAANGQAPDAISISLGGCEAEEVGEVAFRETLNEVFAVAGGAGISVLVAAGDQGSTTCRRDLESGTTALPLLSASDPATSPYVTAVGGTGLKLTAGNRIKREVVWNDSPLSLGAGGGGASILTTPRPWWQQGILDGAGNGRLVPDVAGLADAIPGYSIYCTAPECKEPETLPEGGWQAVGGTSAATPLYAGGVVLADGYNQAHGVPALGFLNPLVYELGREARAGKGGGVLADVTRGNDDLGPLLPVDVGGGQPLGCCSANVGYDAASGWGSLDVANLAKVATGRLGAAQARRLAAERAAARAAERAVEEAKAKLEMHPER